MTKSRRVLGPHQVNGLHAWRGQEAGWPLKWRVAGASLLAIALTTTPFLTSCQPNASNAPSETNALPSSPSLSEQPKRSTKPNKPSSQGILNPSAASRKVTFRQTNGAPEFSLQFKATGGKLVDRAGAVIANLIVESDGVIRLTDASNKTVGYVSQTNGPWQVENPQRTKPLFTFRREANGNATLVRNDGSAVYELQATDSGYIVESGKGDRYTVNAGKGNGQMQTGEGETIMATDGAIAPAALASFGFTRLSQAQQAGLAYALATEAL